MNVLDYALLAQAAYTTEPTFGDHDSASRAVVSNNADGQVVSFPGTDNAACFLADLDIDIITINGLGSIHSGFYEAFLPLKLQLMLCEPAVVTGHSLGASMALLYAAELCLAGKPPKAVLAFEPPHASIDGTLAKLFAAHGVKLLLTQYSEDIVPTVPRIFHPWQHAAPLTRIGTSWEAHLPVPMLNISDHSIAHCVQFYTDNPTAI
jgi:hypothetical protein